MEREDVVHPRGHAQQDLAHHGDMVKMLAVDGGLSVSATWHLLSVLGVIGVGDFNDHRHAARGR
ncbi:hypothetical protein D3C72_2463280 [compost metagenome]